jgi:Contractile injection system tube protein/LysM domain
MAIPEGFQRAKLEIEGGQTIDCAFNPSGYEVSKTNEWTFEPQTGLDLPTGQFSGGLPQRTSISLLLDSSFLGANEGVTVKDQADRLLRMMQADGPPGGGSSPPKITFSWGSMRLPVSVPVTLAVKYLHFHENGEPMRATADIELAQVETAEKGQNPTTQAITGLRVHRVRDGDSLPAIAEDAYGDPTQWRTIAEVNGIDNPFRLRRGAELTIPRIES